MALAGDYQIWFFECLDALDEASWSVAQKFTKTPEKKYMNFNRKNYNLAIQVKIAQIYQTQVRGLDMEIVGNKKTKFTMRKLQSGKKIQN